MSFLFALYNARVLLRTILFVLFLASQRLINTNEIIATHHLDCDMTKFCEQQVSDNIEYKIGQRPGLSWNSLPTSIQ